MENWEKAKFFYSKAVEVAEKNGEESDVYEKNLNRIISKKKK